MNYSHSYHAGNFADVHKHVALVAILQHLKRKATPFAVIDTHAGRGLYDLSGDEARRSGESLQGIGRLGSLVAKSAAVATYLEIVGSFGTNAYPGSPLIATELMRGQDRLVAIEKHPEQFAPLRQALKDRANARAFLADGYTQLAKLLPPPERRGLIFIDPPYEEADERERLAVTIIQAHRVFANGIFLIWLPLKSLSSAEAFLGEIATAGIANARLFRLDVGQKLAEQTERLTVSALLAVNPPYGFDREMQAAEAELLPLLARGQPMAKLSGEQPRVH